MKKYKVGIIGCGRIAPFHGMPAKAQDCVNLTAVCDVVKAHAADRAKLFGTKKTYSDYEEMIRKEKLDVVHICLPHYLHAPVAIRAMELGCHVLTEKPMAISYQQAADMVKASRKTGKTLGVIFQNRYNAGSRLVKRALASGSLGKVLSARCTVNWSRDNTYYTESDWKGTWDKEGGGSIIDQAIHTIDLMCWFIGYGEKGENLDYCDVSLANRAHKGVIEGEDCADGLIAFKNGVKASFWCMNFLSKDAPIEIEIICEKGIAKIESEMGTVTMFDGHEFSAKADPADIFDFGGGASYWGTSHYKQITDFYNALQKGEQPWITGEEILDTAHKMVMGLYESGRKNQVHHF